ncbi:E3 ubiquitin-protein ligase Topors-like [Diorhabda sublineata]|uniref:E3 ubiquitin-protein ligase Topors-like n=1 Tax=Diorhabda sublineata TaxID=1163346 RepID=UPI0024E148D7|nr:E3 ubiquitin-protein ligase Topors-like [Diorhabda sublineata]
MAESQVNVKYYSSSSPPPNCAICLGAFSNKCFSDSCMHQFCFKCLLEWSKIKPECPLCKQPFTRIIHNFKSHEEYDEHVVEIRPPEEVHIIDNEEYLFLPIGQPPQSTRHHFHFRTTFTVDTHGEHAIQQMLLTHPQISVSTSGYPTSRNITHRRRRETATTTSFRRSIYIRNLWVIAPPDVTGRYRDVSPSFYSDCPGARTRLVPWLNRELNALLYENTQLVMRLVDVILDHLLRYHICSRTFRNLLYEYLDNKTDHFIHEFYNFMRSPFDMIGYDRQVIYTERPPTPYIITPQEEISDSGHDSDVIIVGSSNPQEPVIIDLVNTDSDEPILISQEDPPPPELIHIPDNSPEPPSRERECRTPVLPPKLRLKHKRRSREEAREKRYRKRPRRVRSRSTSSSSSSDSSWKASERYRRKKKVTKLKKRLPSSSESEKERNYTSDSDIPLADLINGKRSKRKSCGPKTFSKSSSIATKEFEDINSSSENKDLPSCSKYSEAVDLRTNPRRESPSDLDVPTCSRFTRPSRNCIMYKTRLDDSSDDEYICKPQVKSEIKPIKREPNVTTSKNSELIKNIKIKKENWSNSCLYECNYDSSDNENISNSKSVI